MQHIDKETKQQAQKRFIPLAIAAFLGGGQLWAQTLDTVVVTASRARENAREVSSNVMIIGAEDIKASTATTLAELVHQQGFNIG